MLPRAPACFSRALLAPSAHEAPRRAELPLTMPRDRVGADMPARTAGGSVGNNWSFLLSPNLLPTITVSAAALTIMGELTTAAGGQMVVIIDFKGY